MATKKAKRPTLPILYHVHTKTGTKVPVYFNREDYTFRATLGFTEYSAADANNLSKKLNLAMDAGATLKPSWIPAIVIDVQGPGTYKMTNEISAGMDLTVARKYLIHKSGREVLEEKWETPPNSRGKKYPGHFAQLKKGEKFSLPFFGGYKSYAMPYDEAAWQELSTKALALNKAALELEKAANTGKIEHVGAILTRLTREQGQMQLATRKPIAVHKKPAATPGFSGNEPHDPSLPISKLETQPATGTACRKCVARANGTAEPKKHALNCPNRRTNQVQAA